MSFIADRQTLEDLNIPGKFTPHSIFGIFNQVKTRGGEKLLEEMFRRPLCDAGAINDRLALLQYFHQLRLQLPFSIQQFEQAENYLNSAGYKNKIASAIFILKKHVAGALVRDETIVQLYNGLAATIEILRALKILLEKISTGNVQPAKKILNDPKLAWLTDEPNSTALTKRKFFRYDHLLRGAMYEEMQQILLCIYELDLFIAVSDVARSRGFSYPKALAGTSAIIAAKNLRHPAINHAIGNSVTLDTVMNMLFLTGANMAGKSTFMKSFGIGMFLAHMGFPVAADSMKFTVFDGLFSSINVSDNLSLGYSHFYAEVLRVKQVADAVSTGKKFIVVFDELFKGTNVKDAYDATLAVTTALAKYENCVFIISTHIIEVGHALQTEVNNIQYCYLPTIMEGTIPRYTYLLTDGITSDRHGMIIIRNEKVIETIREKQVINKKMHN